MTDQTKGGELVLALPDTEEALLALVRQTPEVAGTATADSIKDALGNVMPRLEAIKIKHQGTNAFQFPDGKLVTGDVGFVGIILGFTFHNARFAKPFEQREAGERPLCASRNGRDIVPDAPEPQSPGGCATCPINRDATDPDARDKAFAAEKKAVCTNYLAIAVLLPGRTVPYLIDVSATSFKTWGKYVQAIGTAGRHRPHEVVTRFKLVNRANPTPHSVLDLAKEGVLPREKAEAFGEMAERYTALLRAEHTASKADRADDGVAEALAAAKRAAEKAATGESAL